LQDLHSFPTRRSSDLKTLRIPPAAKPVSAVLIRVVRVVPYFADEPCAVTRTEGGAGGVAQLGAADPGPGRIAVKQGEKQGHSFLDRKSTRLNSSHVAI